MDLPLAGIEVHPIEGDDFPEGFSDSGHFDAGDDTFRHD
jgi:hypothetical protein